MHNQVHVCNADNGHIRSVDCWCEPVTIRRMRNKYQIDVLVVEHEDFTLAHRQTVLATREMNRSRNIDEGIDASWITRLLDPFGNLPLLPPHEGD